MTGQPVQGHAFAWHCNSCGAEFLDAMTSSGKPACPKCFAWDIFKVIPRPGHVFVMRNARV